MQTTAKSHTNSLTKPHHKPYHNKPYQPNNNKSLLQKLTSRQPSITQPNKPHSGKLIIAKLGDFVQNKCVFGINCAHLRAQAECFFLHQKRDFEALGVPLPEKYLENQEPLKKSKQERKEDKIREKAEREKRLKEKQQLVEERQKNEEKQNEEYEKEQVPSSKMAQQKIMDQKQLIVQKILKPIKQGEPLTLGHIYQQLNLVADAICQNTPNIYSQQFPLPQLNLTLHELRKRLFLKFKKNKQFEMVQKQMAEKQFGLVKKVIKNVAAAYKEMVEGVGENEKWKNVDLRQVQQSFMSEDVKRVIHLKKDNEQFLKYFERMVDDQWGYPISFQPQQQEKQQEQIQLNKGGLLPLQHFHLLPIIICPSFKFSRLFLSLNISLTHLRSLSQFVSLMIAHQIMEKSLIQKTLVIDILSTSYSKFVDQIMSQFLNDYHEKIKGPGKQFEFGKMEENLKKYRGFLAKYKAKVATLNNNFIVVVYNVKKFVEKIQELGLGELLDYDNIKKDRTMEEEQIYQRVFLLKEFINIMSEGGQGQNVKIVYVTPGKKFKPKNYSKVLGKIDKFLVDNQQEGEGKENNEQ